MTFFLEPSFASLLVEAYILRRLADCVSRRGVDPCRPKAFVTSHDDTFTVASHHHSDHSNLSDGASSLIKRWSAPTSRHQVAVNDPFLLPAQDSVLCSTTILLLLPLLLLGCLSSPIPTPAPGPTQPPQPTFPSSAGLRDRRGPRSASSTRTPSATAGRSARQPASGAAVPGRCWRGVCCRRLGRPRWKRRRRVPPAPQRQRHQHG